MVKCRYKYSVGEVEGLCNDDTNTDTNTETNTETNTDINTDAIQRCGSSRFAVQ